MSFPTWPARPVQVAILSFPHLAQQHTRPDCVKRLHGLFPCRKPEAVDKPARAVAEDRRSRSVYAASIL
jgi:hypothetical protein